MKLLGRLINRLKTANKNRRFRHEIVRKRGRILPGVKIKLMGDAYAGEDIVIGACGIDLFERSQIVVTPGASLIIGNHVGMTSISIFCKKHIEIEDYVNIGAGCLIMDSNFHNTDWHIRENRIKDVSTVDSKSVKICNHVFIGARCIINKSITIGARSIIAAGSVVVKDIPADCIAGGNPCRVIKRINTNENSPT